MKNIQKLDNMIEKAANGEEINLEKGQMIVVSSYNYTRRYLTADHIVIDDIVWKNDLENFLDTLRDLDIDKIIITNTSTALMGLLHFLIENGCVIEGTSTVEDKDGFSKEQHGLLVKIN